MNGGMIRSLALIACMSAIPAIGQDETERELTIKTAVSAILEHHLDAPDIDAEFSRRWFSTYVTALDPSKLYFLDEDILEFENQIKKLPDYASSGDRDFQQLVTSRYQRRVESAMRSFDKRLNDKIDFSVNEEIQLKYDRWAKTEDERSERWRLQIKYDLLIEKSADFSLDDSKAFVKKRYESIHQQAKNMSVERAVGLYLDSFCRTVDPHSGYFTQKEYNSFSMGLLQPRYIGLGVVQENGRNIIRHIRPDFRNVPSATSLVGCELLAVRDSAGDVYNFREIYSHDTSQLIMYGLGRERLITLELYDESSLTRFSVKWPRR